MTAIHFAHGNGFPAPCYGSFLEQLECRRVTAIEKMGHGEFTADGDLYGLVDEVIEAIERQHDEPVIGLGHSTGGVLILLAAAQRPELFCDLILLDPILLCAVKRRALQLSRMIGLGDFLGPTQSAKRRRVEFSSRAEVREILGTKALFSCFDPTCFEDFLEHAFVVGPNGVKLAFEHQVEVAVFRSTQIQFPAPVFECGGLFIHGCTSNMLAPVDVKWWAKRLPRFEVVPTKGGHLFPLEDPMGTAKMIRRRIDATGRHHLQRS